MQITREYAHGGNYDVIVCGGGPAGTAAAIACARRGVKTLLLEQGGCLGGLWTRGLLTWLIDTFEKGPLLDELMEQLTAYADGKAFPAMPRFTADTEKTKLVLENLCQQSGVELRYHTLVTGAVCREGKLSAVLTESKSGPQCFSGTVFVDATGDGDLGCFAGADFALGNEAGKTQPLSLIAHVGGVDKSAFGSYDSRYVKSKETKQRLLADMARSGIAPSYNAPLLAVLSDKYETYGFMANHEYASGQDADQITQATLRGRQELHKIADALREQGGIWKDLRITATGDMIGVREGRRLKGLYRVCAEDVRAGQQFPDGICTVGFMTDIHKLSGDMPPESRKKYGKDHPPYQIPLRSLISGDVENLLMAGRCISGDFVAHASYRVAGPAFRTGEVAGLLAAYCVQNGKLPGTVTDPRVFL